ncbi:MAG TPA: M48 family metalloprotease [Actinomycetota bacterium]|nr:M48 family metalloprotease [Actinomycetota bacterium]
MPPQQRPAARERAVDPARSRVSGTSVGMFALVGVIWLLSLVVVALPAYGAAVPAGWPRVTVVIVACAAWTASAALILIRPVEAGLARLLYRSLRRPRAAELARITPALERVCRRAGTDPRRYLLRVEEKRQVNAFALGGHVLAVTRVALELPDDMLEAVLAHEVGHHRHLHPLAIILGWWYLLPFEAGDRLLRAIRRITRWLSRAFGRLNDRIGGLAGGRAPDGALGMLALLLVLGVLVLVGGVLVVALGLLWLPLSLLVRVAKVLSAALSRAGEHAADRHAAELGYGPGLVQVLFLFQQAEFAAPRPRGMASLLRTHPSSQARIDAIRRTVHPS